MNRIPFETNWHAAKRRIGQLWRPNRPKDVSVSDSPTVYVTTEKLEVQETFAPASLLERATAAVSLPTMPAKKKEETKQQGDALTAWEDEGGAAAAKTPNTANGNTGR